MIGEISEHSIILNMQTHRFSGAQKESLGKSYRVFHISGHSKVLAKSQALYKHELEIWKSAWDLV